MKQRKIKYKLMKGLSKDIDKLLDKDMDNIQFRGCVSRLLMYAASEQMRSVVLSRKAKKEQVDAALSLIGELEDLPITDDILTLTNWVDSE